jgi:hypothetical protein
MAAQAMFEGGEVEVAPGGLAVLQLTVVNLGDSTETFAITVAGMAASWTTVHPPTVTLFGGTHETVDVEIRPPKLPSTADGPTGLTARIVPLGSPDDIITAETRLVIGASHDRQLTLLQPALRSRRSSVYEVMLENQGNTQASCRLHLVDSTGRLDGDFDPPSIGVEPGAIAIARLKLRANRLQWNRQSRPIPFAVEAEQPTCPTASATATFVQTPVLPERLAAGVVGVALAVAALAAAWFVVVQPAIDRSVDDAVGQLAPVASTPVPGPETSVPETAPPTTVVLTQPFSTRLSADAAQGSTNTAVYEVPDGQTLQVTDVVLQNPGGDDGTVTVLRDDEVLFQWSLATVFGDAVRQFVTPIELTSRQTLRLQVECTTVGNTAAGACTPGVVVSGELLG